MRFGSVIVLLVVVSGTAEEPTVHPRDLAHALAVRNVPAGVILPTELLELGQAPRTLAAHEGADVLLRRLKATDLDAMADTSADGVVKIRWRKEPEGIRTLLQREHHIDAQASMSAARVLHVVSNLIRGEDRQGVVGSGLMPVSDCPFDEQVMLPAGPTTVERILDGIVQQQPGKVWFLTYSQWGIPEQELSVGLICGEFWMSTEIRP